MAAIDTYLQQIRTAVYGRDVRSAIANGIEECYNYVTAFEGLDLSNLATKAELDDYLSKTEANSIYVTLDALSPYITEAEVSNAYVTKSELLTDYISEEDADDKYALKDDLDNYLTSAQIASQYVKKGDVDAVVTFSDLADYVTKTEADDSYISIENATSYALQTDLLSYATLTYVDETFARQSDFVNFHSFDIIICSNPYHTPEGIYDSDGVLGQLEASNATMNKIYLVGKNIAADIKYEKYITVQTGESTFIWERFGGNDNGSNSGNDDNSSGSINLDDYITYEAADQRYESKGILDSYLQKDTADLLYVNKESLGLAIADVFNNTDYVRHDELMEYLTQTTADSMYASKSLLLNSYTTSEALYRDYATKAYVDSFVVTFPTGENILQMLEIDNIPGTTQRIIYDQNGDILRIDHNKTGNSSQRYRTDTFSFEETKVTETRVLSTGQKLVIVTNLETLDTTTTYTASA